MFMSRRRFLRLIAACGALLSVPSTVWARTLRVRTGSWLEVQAFKGDVTYYGRRHLRAWVGLRFKNTGDALETGRNATAVLALQSGLGTIYVAEQTKLTVRQMTTTPDGGIVTLLEVSQGQVRLKVRSLTNPSSRLEIITPSGVAGVRGTEFGVSIQPSGQTGIATRSGLVGAVAQGETVAVAQAMQSLVVPQSPPTTAQLLRDDPGLTLDVARPEGKQIRLIGKIDPVNIMLIEGQPQNTDRDGAFDRLVGQWRGNVIQVKVITPLGTMRRYELPVIF
jgi:FecR protein